MALNMAVLPIYYGRSFVAGPGQGSFNSGDMDAAIGKVCASAYFDAAKDFGVGTIRLQATGDVAPTDPPGSWADPTKGFTNDNIADFLRSEIGAGRAPVPTSLPDTPLYVVILKRGLFSKDHGGAVGYHFTFVYQGTTALCAWVMQGNDLDGTSPIVSHEVVEAAASSVGAGEVTDPCGQQARINGVLVEAYANAHHACVIPGVFTQPLPSAVWMTWKGVDADAGIYSSQLANGAWAPQQRLNGVGTSNSPALSVHDGALFMAWKGAGNDQGIWYSRYLGAGWMPQKLVAGVGTSNHPALASHNGTLYLAWKGAGSDQGIWWTRWLGDRWAGQQNIPNRGTSRGPAMLAEGNLHMIWKGVEGDSRMYAATLDPNGQAWSAQVPVPGFGTSESPGLALEPTFVGDPDKLLMTWKGVPGDSKIYQAIQNAGSWSGQELEIGIGTSSQPAALGNGSGKMWRAWKGIDGDAGIYWSESNEGLNWSAQVKIPGVGTSHGPALVLF